MKKPHPTAFKTSLRPPLPNQKWNPLPRPKSPPSSGRVISPRPLPPEGIRTNLIYAEKVRTGKIIIDRSGHYIRAIELPDTTENLAALDDSSEKTQHPLST